MLATRNDSKLIIAKTKEYTSRDGSSLLTGYNPGIRLLCDNKKIITPQYNIVQDPFVEDETHTYVIDWRVPYNETNEWYESIQTQNNPNYQVSFTFYHGQYTDFYWEDFKTNSGQILNIDYVKNIFPGMEGGYTFGTYTSDPAYYYFKDIYWGIGTPKVYTINATPNVTTGTDTNCSVYLQNNSAVQPSNLGCALLFSATQIPDKAFCVGFKGGTGGSMYQFAGKIYPISKLKSLGNNMYLFYDNLMDSDFPFCTKFRYDSHLRPTTAMLKMTAPVICGNVEFKIISDGVTAFDNNVNTRTFQDFGFISYKTFVSYAPPDEDKILRISPSTATISPRFNSYSVISGKRNSTNEAIFYHSMTKYADEPNYGYDWFGTTNVTAINNWGYWKDITATNGSTNNALEVIPDSWGDNFDKVVNANAMFYNCSLKKIPAKWRENNTHSWEYLTNCNSMFGNCSELTSIPNNWYGVCRYVPAYNPQLGIDMSHMFGNCTKLQKIPDSWMGTNPAGLTISSLYSVKSMSHAFGDCDITAIPNSWVGLPCVENAYQMFNNNKKLKKIPSTWEGLGRLKNAENMFAGCTALTDVPTDLFEKCPSLTSITSMFAGCKSITSDIEPFITAGEHFFGNNTTAYSKCFEDCTNVPNYSTLRVDHPSWFAEV